ncbi:MAG: cysteine hydrolase family protein [Pseudomonadota bacterium]
MAKTALILIDLQNDYFPGGRWALEGIDAAAGKAARLLEAARRSGDLVIHVHHEFESSDAPFFTPGSEGARIHHSVQPIDGELQVLKHKVNAFQGTDLKTILEERGIETLVVCGAMSHMCIDGAVRAASDFGFAVTLIHDACATRDQEFGGTTVPAAQAHAAFMSALGFAYANVISADDYLATVAKAA